MTPDEMSDRLAAWACRCDLCCHDSRRVVCLEPDGPRRTWVLYESGRQVGLVRMRGVGASSGRPYGGARAEWTVEASDRTRAMLGL